MTEKPDHVWIGRRYSENTMLEEYARWDKEDAMDEIAERAGVSDPDWSPMGDGGDMELENSDDALVVVLKTHVE